MTSHRTGIRSVSLVVDVDTVDKSQHAVKFVERAWPLLQNRVSVLVRQAKNLECTRLNEAMDHRPYSVAVLPSNVNLFIDHQPGHILPRGSIHLVRSLRIDAKASALDNPLQSFAGQPQMGCRVLRA